MDWRSIPSLASLRAFETTARNLSFSQAARELNVTHAAIAQHVRGLETYFNQSLVVRNGKGLALTGEGAQLSHSLKQGFQYIADGVDDLRQVNENRPVSISVTPVFAHHWLMPRIGAFWNEHPDISININPQVGLVDLVQDGFDMAIRFGSGEWPNLKSEPLTDADFVVVAHPNLIGDREIHNLQELEVYPWLMEYQMMEKRAIFEQEGLDLSKVKLTSFDSNGLVLSGVLAGLGVTAQPASLVKRDIKAGNLRELCVLDQTDLAYHLVTVPDRETANLKTFKTWLKSVVD